MLERAVRLGRANLAEDDPDVLATSLQLGRLHQQTGDPSAARRVLEDAYAAGQWRLGDHDPLMVEISQEIGVAAEELGNRHEARKAFTRVAQFGPAALGANHQAVARARAYLGQGVDSVRAEPPVAAATPLTFFTPATNEEPTTMFGAVPSPRPAADDEEEPTSVFGAIPVVPEAMGTVAPPPASTPVWTPPQHDSAVRGPLEEATAAQPVITPRGTTPVLPDQRPAAAPAQNSGIPVSGGSAPGQAPGLPQTSGAPGYGTPGMPAQGPGYGGNVPGYASAGGVPVQTSGGPGYGGYPGGGYGVPPVAGSPGQIHDPGSERDAYKKRSLGLFAAIAAVMAAVIAVVALVFVLANRPAGGSSGGSNVPTLAGPAPSGVRLRDQGAEIIVTWTDPTQGTVSFMVARGHPGEQLQPVGTFGPGQTSYTARGLNPGLNYCFAVIAVYRADRMSTSTQVCTKRTPAS